jgi:hypothetical protein
MINLEELQLYVFVIRFDSTYIDGIQLFDEFLIYMTQLNKFTFSIKTRVSSIYRNLLELPTNEDIQRSFMGRYNQQVVSYVQNNSMKTEGKCHIYTFPYEFEYFYHLDNSFQRGMFHKVRYLTMYDRIAFEHKLFQIISEEFPFLEFLYITNPYPMQDKQSLFTLITFPCLTLLDLKCAHVDYAELFLLKKNLHLPCLLNLAMEYESLTMITNNFTNNAAHFNFERLKSLDVCQLFVRPKNFHQYFPLL